MPIYEYHCQACGKNFDAIRSMKDADTAILCKHCKSEQTRRKVSVFYATSEGRSVTTSSGGGCSGCSGGSCSSCGH